MSQFGIRPQEIYLIERYSSVEYFKELVDAFENMLNAAEYALQVFMQVICAEKNGGFNLVN
ncbi:hypothetical protein KTH40_16045 [Acinetobacter haemolyticus]|uniref:hypothetical protein n=1 Tax=Acinetobacter haemolyticus TaxID=29430 RepID=UPI0021D20E62|nr:hypothetical protein [Acinetobacter haemolyticus]MCU4389089.1 hypothetical protein [Acinetobacter haemolyticus]